MVLKVSVLGPIEASTDGFEHPIGGPKQQGLLVQLAMAHGRTVSVDRLINDLWEGSPPGDPSHALQARVSRLRSALPINIEMAGGGYRVDPATIATDAERFEQLCALGSASRTEGALSQAANHFVSALDLWHGEPFAGLPDIATFRAESTRLEKLWSDALSDRIDLDLALGRGAAVIAELHSLLEEYPFAERHWVQLMIALYCEGRVQEALDTFARARSTFADELGIEPSSELGGLHRAILQGQAPESLIRLPAAISLVDTLDLGGNQNDVPNHKLSSSQPDVLVALLRRHRALLLTGPAGIGKTHLLRAVHTRFEAQRCAVSLLRASPLSLKVPLGIFTSILPEKWASPAALVDHFTRHRSTTVLLVDNVDQLDEASLFVISQLIRNSRVPTVLSIRNLADAPEEIRALYDSGEIFETTVSSLSASAADEFVAQTIGGALTPKSRSALFDAANGVPLFLREILTASVDDGRLIRTDHGWELHGDPASTKRLTQLVGERFENLDDDVSENAAKVAIAGEYPASALGASELRAFTRTGIVKYSEPGWLRLTNPLDREFLHERCADALWQDLSREVLATLLGKATAEFPAMRRRAHILALELGEPVNVEATLAVAEHALGAFNERLALHAAEAVIQREPDNSCAHRFAGLAASGLSTPDEAAVHFIAAKQFATNATDFSAASVAHARHLGMYLHDAVAALSVINEALQEIQDPIEVHHLQRDAMRWAVMAGQTVEPMVDPGDASDVAAVLSLITYGVSGVITGPLTDAERALSRLRKLPVELVELVPGGMAMIELTDVMALSNTGDVDAARRRLNQAIQFAEQRAPESLGIWEYALGFSELLSGDLEQAYTIAVSAVTHLEWRDTTGLLPAAQALVGASAAGTGRKDQMSEAFAAVPEAANHDPKVVMLRAWADAWQKNRQGRHADAARLLAETARWLLLAQHSYFAGILAHCAIRVGASECLDDAIAVLEEARQIAGGGLLDLLARHGSATLVGDRTELEQIARDAATLGMHSTAVDTWRALGQRPKIGNPVDPDLKHQSPTQAKSMPASLALWSPR